MRRLHFIEETLDISPDKFAFACKPVWDHDLLDNVVEEGILPGGMQHQSRLQFSPVAILRKGDQIIQHPCRRMPAREPYLHNLDNSHAGCT